LLVKQRDIVAVRASAVEQRHRHEFGPAVESDRHRTWFAEASLAMPRAPFTYVVGAAFQSERYRNTELPGFDYDFRIPSVFAQADVDAASWLALSASARLDAHSAYATTVSPRVSALLRPTSLGSLAGWSSRVSIGGGTFAPVPFTEETEVVGLSALVPLTGLQTERAVGGSIDINGPIELRAGTLELNATVFGSRLTHPLAARDASTDVPRLELVNAPEPTRSWGAELLGRLIHGPARVTATYAYVRGSEWNPDVAVEQNLRRDVPLVPRHTAGVVASLESEERYRLGVEAYYTGRQSLDDNPFRDTSRPYVIFGLLGERWVKTGAGVARLFINFENIGDVRQTRYDSLVRPTRGKGGRWTTDAWTELSGFTVNGGVRFSLGK
jgi:iron complex outermembrane receptor protein